MLLPMLLGSRSVLARLVVNTIVHKARFKPMTKLHTLKSYARLLTIGARRNEG